MIVLAWTVVALVAALTAHTAVNALLLRRVPSTPSGVATKVSVLLPVRDEAHRLLPCLRALLAQRGVAGLDIVVLDDESSDGTPDLVRRVAGGDPRLRLVTGTPPPPGWLGKPHACHQLAAHADPDSPVLVFIDADVVLTPDALAAAVALLDGGAALVSAYPRMVAVSAGERLVQPLLAWTWLTFLPLRAMERSKRTSLAAAGGQFLVLDREAYRRAGGHAAVRDKVLEDVELARAVKRHGGRITMADASRVANCRMYASWHDVVAGYTKSLWAAFGSPAAAFAVAALLTVAYVVPAPAVLLAAVLAVAGRAGWEWVVLSAVAYLLGVLGRVIAGRTTHARVWPDALGHPLSIALFVWLIAISYVRHRRGRLSWKDRPIGVQRSPTTREAECS